MNENVPVVFVVDDDPAIREALQSLIRSVGLSVETFASAQELELRLTSGQGASADSPGSALPET